MSIKKIKVLRNQNNYSVRDTSTFSNTTQNDVIRVLVMLFYEVNSKGGVENTRLEA